MNESQFRTSSICRTERPDLFSGDLIPWVGAEVLVHAALMTAKAAWGQAALSTGNFSPAVMGAVLIYFYARAEYDSEEIELKLPVQPIWPQLLGKAFPDQHAIRQFRRRNYQQLLEALAGLLEKMDSCRSAGVGRNGITPDSFAGPESAAPRPKYFQAAQLRLLMALEADCMARDE